jgi:hypothetical protein
MPIYDLKINEQTRCGDIDEIEMFSTGDPKITRVVHLGFGDVAVSTAMQEEDIDDRVLMFTQHEVHEIGEPNDDILGQPVVPPVKIYFDNITSIDVVIGELSKLKNKLQLRSQLESETEKE